MPNLLLLSGGIDSTALAAWQQPSATLFIDYGQRPAAGEAVAASVIAQNLGLPHYSMRIDCSQIGSGMLAASEPVSVAPSAEWWPYRNQLLITIAAAWAIPRGFDTISIGAVASDSFHLDGKPDFFRAIDGLLGMQEGSLRVSAPAINMTSAQLVRTSGISMGVLGWTISCHRGADSCGDCPGCNKHAGVINELRSSA